jgi:serine/threonine protein kinase
MPGNENDAQAQQNQEGLDSLDDLDEVGRLNAIYSPHQFTPIVGHGTQSVGVYRVDRFSNGKMIDQVAAKVFYNDAIDEVVRKQLNGWKRISAHESIIQYHDLDTKYKGYAVIFMEYFPGQALDKFIYDFCEVGKNPNKMAFNEYRTILNTILNGIQHAHTYDVMHMDIKPDNLLVKILKRKPLLEFIAKLVDFGIAQVQGEEISSTKGAMGYRAPESHRTATVRPSADLFSAGIVADQMFSGDMARRLRTIPEKIADKRVGGGEITKRELEGIVAEWVKPERYVAGGKASPECAAVIANSIMKCLQFAPSMRYQSAEALRIDLSLSSELDEVKKLDELVKAAGIPDGMEKLLKQYKFVKKLAGTMSPRYFHDTMLAGAVNSFREHRRDVVRRVCTYAYLRQSEKYKQTPAEQKKAIDDLFDVKIDCPDEEDKKRIEECKKEALQIMTAVANQNPRPVIAEADNVAMTVWKGFFNRLGVGDLKELTEMWLM